MVKREEVPEKLPAPKLAAGKHGSAVKSEVKGEARLEDAPNDGSLGEQDDDIPMEDEQQTGKQAEAAVRVKEEGEGGAHAAARSDGAATGSGQDSAASDSIASSLAASPAHPFSTELDVSGGDVVDDELLLPHELMTPVQSTSGAHPNSGFHSVATPTFSAAAASSMSYHPPSHIDTALTSSLMSEADREKSKRKLHAMQRSLSSVSDQLKSVTAMSNMWEAKYKEEKVRPQTHTQRAHTRAHTH